MLVLRTIHRKYLPAFCECFWPSGCVYEAHMAREVYSPGSAFLKRGLDSDQSVKDRTMSDPPHLLKRLSFSVRRAKWGSTEEACLPTGSSSAVSEARRSAHNSSRFLRAHRGRGKRKINSKEKKDTTKTVTQQEKNHFHQLRPVRIKRDPECESDGAHEQLHTAYGEKNILEIHRNTYKSQESEFMS